MNQAVEGVRQNFWGLYLTYLMTSRFYFIDLSLLVQMSTPDTYPLFSFQSGFYYNFLRGGKYNLGCGFHAYTNIYNDYSSIYDSVPAVAPTMLDVFPALLLSSVSPKLEANLMMSPVSFYFGESYAHTTAHTMLAGLRSKLDLRYFFGLRPGIRLALEYQYMWNVDGDQKDSGLGVVETFTMLNATLGMVYRY